MTRPDQVSHTSPQLRLPCWHDLRGLIKVPKDPEGHVDVKSRCYGLHYEHMSVRRRLEDSAWFAQCVSDLSARGMTNSEVVRNFEAFVFFARSVLDCEAYFVNDLCMLRASENVVGFRNVHSDLQQRAHDMPDLADLWGSAKDSDWFKHLDLLRNVLAHRRWTRNTVVVESRASLSIGVCAKVNKSAIPTSDPARNAVVELSRGSPSLYISTAPDTMDCADDDDPSYSVSNYSQRTLRVLCDFVERVCFELSTLLARKVIKI
jgi:hypothetical protein